MEPATIPEPAGFSDLSKTDQIRYLQSLWDRIAERPGEIPVKKESVTEYRLVAEPRADVAVLHVSRDPAEWQRRRG